ncbi:MAG: hypothetical protein JXX28_06340 [Deltaproteobacteria bacterium]|nr:hypothetical protein [Deltaproteobacteria bacterium]
MELVVGVAGATGALGKELIELLDGASWRPAELRPLASPASKVPFVDYGEHQIAVDNLDDQVVGELDALFLVTPPGIAAGVGATAVHEGVVTIDLSGALGGDLPLVDPVLLPRSMEDAMQRGGAVLPGAPALALSRVLGALKRELSITGWDAVVNLPASHWGRDGLEELSNQVIALFNQGTPTRKKFPTGLAFDLIPQVGEAEEDGHSSEELAVLGQVRALSGVGGGDVTLVGVPVFSGMSGVIRVQVKGSPALEQVRGLLAAGQLHLPPSGRARHIPHPRSVDGREDLSVGRVRVSEGEIHLWFALDNLRVMAALAVGVCGMLVRGER